MMHSNMTLVAHFLVKSLVTKFAHEPLDLAVDPHVLYKVFLSREHFIANVTEEILHLRMHYQVVF